jgi:hypothetical protein
MTKKRSRDETSPLQARHGGCRTPRHAHGTWTKYDVLCLPSSAAFDAASSLRQGEPFQEQRVHGHEETRARHREGRDLGPKHQPEGRLEHAGRDRYRHRVVADGPSGAPEPFQRQSSRWPGTSHRRGAPPRRPSHPRAHRDGEPRSTRAARAGGSSSGSGVHVVAHPHKPITRHRVPLIRWRISRARR